MNRYEILLGKTPPPKPPLPPPPPPIREILIGGRRAGKTTELVNCIIKAVIKNIEPVVVVYHKEDYIRHMLGSYEKFVRIIPKSWLRNGPGSMRGFPNFYYDDIDLYHLYERSARDSLTLDQLSDRGAFVDKDEVIVTCDTQELCRCLRISQREIPYKVQIGHYIWDIIQVPRQSPFRETFAYPLDFKMVM